MYTKKQIVILTMMDMKNSVFWDITPCSPLQVNRRFRGRIACIFRVEEEAEQDTNVKASDKRSD
jgi:hypothetical protein